MLELLIFFLIKQKHKEIVAIEIKDLPTVKADYQKIKKGLFNQYNI